jgi:hypothetical protein
MAWTCPDNTPGCWGFEPCDACEARREALVAEEQEANSRRGR